jgi:dihydroorotase
MILIKNALIVNENKKFKGNILLDGDRISKISREEIEADGAEVIDATGLMCLPGLIDDQVHFREPGLTHKAELYTESRAAVAGGITSFMEMPNTVPNTLNQELLQDKYDIAAEKSLANYSFYMGASNDNLGEVLKTDPKKVCGVKVFMGSSTGNMLVDNRATLEGLFSECEMLIASHCEDEETIRSNMKMAREKFGEEVPIELHPVIRSAEACYRSSSMAAELAAKHNTRLHILHISTEKEMSIFDADKPLSEKRLTAEACIHHLWFCEEDYAKLGPRIKWNPAVKSRADRKAIREGLIKGKIDVLATDHAPHTWDEKQRTYFKAPAGGPLVQHALPALLEMWDKGIFELEMIVQKYCHNVADMFSIADRGYIREGYKADLVLINPEDPWVVTKDNILYKAGWSPFEGHEFTQKVVTTFVNGKVVYDKGAIVEAGPGERLEFDR